MDSGVIVVIVMSVIAVGLLVWLELHSRRKKRNGEAGQSGGGSPQSTEVTKDID